MVRDFWGLDARGIEEHLQHNPDGVYHHSNGVTYPGQFANELQQHGQHAGGDGPVRGGIPHFSVNSLSDTVWDRDRAIRSRVSDVR